MTETNTDGYIFINQLPRKIIYKQYTSEIDLSGLQLAKVVSWNPTAISRVPDEKIHVSNFDTSKIGSQKVLLHTENYTIPFEIIIVPQ